MGAVLPVMSDEVMYHAFIGGGEKKQMRGFRSQRRIGGQTVFLPPHNCMMVLLYYTLYKPVHTAFGLFSYETQAHPY
jgi:hypothetical protein